MFSCVYVCEGELRHCSAVFHKIINKTIRTTEQVFIYKQIMGPQIILLIGHTGEKRITKTIRIHPEELRVIHPVPKCLGNQCKSCFVP